jgi:hypothetical protein
VKRNILLNFTAVVLAIAAPPMHAEQAGSGHYVSGAQTQGENTLKGSFIWAKALSANLKYFSWRLRELSPETTRASGLKIESQ